MEGVRGGGSNGEREGVREGMREVGTDWLHTFNF